MEKPREAGEGEEGQVGAGWLTSALAASSVWVRLAVGKRNRSARALLQEGAYCALRLPPKAKALRSPRGLVLGPSRAAAVFARVFSASRCAFPEEAGGLWGLRLAPSPQQVSKRGPQCYSRESEFCRQPCELSSS